MYKSTSLKAYREKVDLKDLLIFGIALFFVIVGGVNTYIKYEDIVFALQPSMRDWLLTPLEVWPLLLLILGICIFYSRHLKVLEKIGIQIDPIKKTCVKAIMAGMVFLILLIPASLLLIWWAFSGLF